MRLFLILLLSTLIGSTLSAQMVSLLPASAGADDEATLVFDASEGNGELEGANKVYLHHGLVVSSESGTDWSYVIGNWGQDDGIGEMTQVEGEANKWEIKFSPTIREYFKVPEGENIFRITAVFRSVDGNTKGTMTSGTYSWGEVNNGDFFINLNTSDYVTFTNPTSTESYINTGESIRIAAVATAEVSSMAIFIDQGDGYEEKATVSSGKSIALDFTPSMTGLLNIKVQATINGEVLEEEQTHQVVLLTDTEIVDLPEGATPGINYLEDETKVLLVLEAPRKEFVYVVGDHSGWAIQEASKMKKTSDGELFWIELENLEANKPYIYQYWIDGEIKVGDPYADQVADPWNDKYIDEMLFTNIPSYTKTEHGLATVFQTGQTAFSWSDNEETWEKPNDDQIVIYELLVRDFVESHAYYDLIDTISYLKNLGVDAIELMPTNEFEGNESWGYNPSYYFAPDKYYGTKNDLKYFIDVAHQNGMAVIMDVVLNHAFGSNPMVRMYWDETNNRPAADNPWFNAEYVGSNQWGYDFNHESEYTQRFVDRVNKYWLEEFHFDGYRFDFTKGFTNYAPGGNTDGFDQSRIDILKRMSDEIWKVDESAYVILEHWGTGSEETVLGEYGCKLWRRNDHDFRAAVNGENTGTFSSSTSPNHVVFFDSHDENRIANVALASGLSEGSYNIKNPMIMLERMKMAAAFQFLQPGPKMIWMFDELAYDIHIDFNGRVGNKPLPWGSDGLGYYEDQNRKYVYDAYKGILDVRKKVDPVKLAEADVSHKNSGNTRRLSFDTDGIDLVVVGNFDLVSNSIDPAFSQTGEWFDYFSGETVTVSDMNADIELKAGEWHIYTSEKISDGMPGVVEVFESPVSISPATFTMSEEITITFDAKKSWNNGTGGLLGASNVFLTSGLIKEDPNSTDFDTKIEGEAGKMTALGDDVWQIKLIPSEYFNELTAYKMGMYFTDGGSNLGKGFRNSTIFYDIQSTELIVEISPKAFEMDEEITITFRANQGNRELMGTSKVYMHSGVSKTKTDDPTNSAWQNVIGNWGADDGIGELTEVDEDIWQITFTPKSYYQLNDDEHAYWISSVFRSADGNTKGTTSAGDLENGFVSSGLDFFIRNFSKTAVSTTTTEEFVVYPNPAKDKIFISGITEPILFQIYNLSGQICLEKVIDNNAVSLDMLDKGVYIYRANTKAQVKTGRIVLE